MEFQEEVLRPCYMINMRVYMVNFLSSIKIILSSQIILLSFIIPRVDVQENVTFISFGSVDFLQILTITIGKSCCDVKFYLFPIILYLTISFLLTIVIYYFLKKISSYKKDLVSHLQIITITTCYFISFLFLFSFNFYIYLIYTGNLTFEYGPPLPYSQTVWEIWGSLTQYLYILLNLIINLFIFWSLLFIIDILSYKCIGVRRIEVN